MIKALSEKYVSESAQLGKELWPEEELDDLKEDFKESLDASNETVFLYFNKKNKVIGFIQLSIRRDYVEGSESSPVGYVEGIYVEENDRHLGVASKLIKRGETWIKSFGIDEIASDCELKNRTSIEFHKNVGFQESNRLVCFIKKI